MNDACARQHASVDPLFHQTSTESSAPTSGTAGCFWTAWQLLCRWLQDASRRNAVAGAEGKAVLVETDEVPSAALVCLEVDAGTIGTLLCTGSVWLKVLSFCSVHEAASSVPCCTETLAGARDGYGRLLAGSVTLSRGCAAMEQLARISPHLLVKLSLPSLASGAESEAVLKMLAQMRFLSTSPHRDCREHASQKITSFAVMWLWWLGKFRFVEGYTWQGKPHPLAAKHTQCACMARSDAGRLKLRPLAKQMFSSSMLSELKDALPTSATSNWSYALGNRPRLLPPPLASTVYEEASSEPEEDPVGEPGYSDPGYSGAETQEGNIAIAWPSFGTLGLDGLSRPDMLIVRIMSGASDSSGAFDSSDLEREHLSTLDEQGRRLYLAVLPQRRVQLLSLRVLSRPDAYGILKHVETTDPRRDIVIKNMKARRPQLGRILVWYSAVAMFPGTSVVFRSMGSGSDMSQGLPCHGLSEWSADSVDGCASRLLNVSPQSGFVSIVTVPPWISAGCVIRSLCMKDSVGSGHRSGWDTSFPEIHTEVGRHRLASEAFGRKEDEHCLRRTVSIFERETTPMAESIEDSDILLMPSMSHLKSGLMVDGHDGTDECLLADDSVLAELVSVTPKHLTRLGLDLNSFSCRDAHAVARVIARVTGLRELRLLFHGRSFAWLGTGTEDTGTEELASALPAGLQKLHLMLESCTETCFAALAAALHGLTVLQLRLADFNMNLSDLRSIATALPSSLSDLRLDLCCRDVGDDGASTLATNLPKGLERLTLCLRDWRFTAVGMRVLAAAVPRSVRQLKLVVSSSAIGVSGVGFSPVALMARLRGPRQLLLLKGDPKWAQTVTSQILASWKTVHSNFRILRADLRDPPQRAWMGQELDAVVLSAHRRRFLDAFGAVSGALKGGGVLIFQTPPFQHWRAERIGSRWCSLLEQLEAGEGQVRTFHQNEETESEISAVAGMLPLGQCLHQESTQLQPNEEQRELIEIILGIKASRPLLVSGRRGRGKSATLGMAAAVLLQRTGGRILVTSPSSDASSQLFWAARCFLGDCEKGHGRALFYGKKGSLEFIVPERLAELSRTELKESFLIIDEAAGFPVNFTAHLLQQAGRVLLATTLDGYEGSGNGFLVRALPQLRAARAGLQTRELRTSWRWARGCPLEVLSRAALLLDAVPAAVSPAAAETIARSAVLEAVDRGAIVKDDDRLKEIYGLLRVGHYKTKPSDLETFLDAKGVVWLALRYKNNYYGITISGTEEPVLEEKAQQLWLARCQVAANLTAQTLTRDAGILEASTLRFVRVMRWCLHPNLRGYGLGERLLVESLNRLKSLSVDAVAAHFGATSWLIKLWLRQGARVVHVSHGCDPSSGQHSVSVLIPLTERGRRLCEILEGKLQEELPELLSGPLADLAGDALRELLKAIECPKASFQDQLDSWSFAFGARSLSNCKIALRRVVLQSLQVLTESEDEFSFQDRKSNVKHGKLFLDLLQGRPILSEMQLRQALRHLPMIRDLHPCNQNYGASAGVMACPPCPAWPPPEPLIQNGGAVGISSNLPWSFLDLTAPIRSQIFFNLVGDLLCYSGANEVNLQLSIVRSACRELRDQVDEECLTFNYDDTCGLGSGPSRDRDEILALNTWIKRHPRLKYFECLVRSASKFRILLEELQLPPRTRCSFVFEFKVTGYEVEQLLQRFCVRRLSLMPQEDKDGAGQAQRSWKAFPESGLQVLCLRSCSDEIIQSFFAVSPRLRSLQLVDSRLQSMPLAISQRLSSLSLTGITSLADEQLSKLIASCQNLRSLYIAKCHVSHISFALSNLELLSVTHCQQLTDQCATEILSPVNNPRLRFVDLSECQSLTAPTVEHPQMEIAWLMHCPQLTGQVVAAMFRSCTALTAVNLVQSSIENAMLASTSLRTLELTTSQKLADRAVTYLLEHCPNLSFLDVGHCCQLVEPKLAHPGLETILLSFCVNLRESAVAGLFENCPSLRYVEIAVCMFDMTKFQRTCRPECTIVVNFDF
ncbi:tmcA [Symbiodinium sp. KB8]|nr:tmcA [Symbiodinium sp. KB8]